MPERNTDPVAMEEPVRDRPLLALREIGMTYPGRDHGEPLRVFENIDLAVEKGDLVVAAGRSGSGKTTLLHIAAGLLRPTAGNVHWADVALDDLDDDRLARIRGRTVGIVFQNAALIETLTAAENVALQAVPSGMRDGRERALELLARQGLADRARHYPSHLSGGEQQRVAFARALYADPPLLILVRFLDAVAIGSDGIKWKSARLCADDLRLLQATPRGLVFEGDNLGGSATITVDPETGEQTAGTRINWP